MDPIILTGILIVYALHLLIVERRLVVSERREKVLFDIVRRLENRVHAKDLSGYMALESEDKKNREVPAVAPPRGRSDAEEAILEQMRNGGNGYE